MENTTVKKIVYLPLDERPCNYSFAGFLSEENEKYTLVRPELSDLGDCKVPAKFEKVRDFLLRECKSADYLIIAIDMLLYGGIVPSRLHKMEREELVKRLAVLSEIKAENPALRVYAFSLVMRCPCYSDNSEEPEYYGVVGQEIFEYGQCEHKYRDGLITESEYNAERERLKVCVPYLDDFLTRRKCNVSMFDDILDLIGGVIDEFVILQDDSNPCGYTAMDQARVRGMIKEKGVHVDIYPGADEGGMTLLARAVAHMMDYKVKFLPIYPKDECKNVIPMYEDREVYKSIAAQVKSAGGVICDSEDEADVLLFCNLPVGETHNVSKRGGPQYDARELPLFVEKIKDAVEAGRGVAVADIAYCNGADVDLTELLTREVGLLKLWGFAGWNTSSNTLGTTICQATLRYFFGDTKTHRRFTAERVYEDIGYCSAVRWHVWNNEVVPMGYRYEDTKVARGAVSERIEELLNIYVNEKYPEIAEKYMIADCYMPWRRMFEVGLIINEK